MFQSDKLFVSATTLVTSLLFYSYARASGRDETPLVMIGAFAGALIGEVLADHIEGQRGNISSKSLLNNVGKTSP